MAASAGGPLWYRGLAEAPEDSLGAGVQAMLGRLQAQHIVVGQKSGFESHLQGILTAAERDRLHSDADFTQAWQIFVDLCWIKKQLARAGMILAAIVVLMLVVLAVLWAIPKVAQGPLPQTGPH